ncbi:MAG: Mov34/MPN/PAD-1 family protein [Chloroflexi bacterium]|nr:Mov34/MPN/PAD-1 family protein [Chloroflexota bacterium]MBU1751667.1 Mov34/MPN/PAD-1 family protein [Chloroflexota bacterium]
MTERRIKLLQVPPPLPPRWPMPLDESIRWVSPYEAEVDRLVEIFFTQHAYLRCMEHAASDLQHEIGGALVGQVLDDVLADARYVVIEDVIPAEHTEFSRVHLTFTQSTLVQLNNTLEDHYPDLQMVGWYHTHPRMSVFLSSYDAWLHRNFFREPWQVALVVEPYRGHGGFFPWQPDRHLDPRAYAGFYELADLQEESVVDWINLEPVQPEPVLAGETDFWEIEEYRP